MATYDETVSVTAGTSETLAHDYVTAPSVSEGAGVSESVIQTRDTYLAIVQAVAASETLFEPLPYLDYVVANVEMQSAVYGDIAFVLKEGIAIEAVTSAGMVFAQYVADGIGLEDAVKNVIPLILSEQVGVASPATDLINKLLKASDVLRATGVVTTQRESFLTVVSATLIQSLAELAYDLTASDVMSMSSTISVLRTVLVEAMEEAAIASTALGQLSFVVVATSELEVDSSPAAFGEFILKAEDIIDFRGELITPDGAAYSAWVTNFDTAGMYQYTNYAFNSFAMVGTTAVGCASDGLYVLEGDDDEGAAIQASFKTGLMDFGSPQMKRMTDAILAYSADGDLILRVTTTDEGHKQEYYYTLSETHGAPKEGRIKLGKGARARYWQFELENVNGADFNLDDMAVIPVTLKRRV